MSDPPGFVHAEAADVDAVARIIADAWCDLDQAAWLVPNRRERRTILGEVARIHVEHALFYGTVEVLRDGTAVAVWFDRHRPLPPPLDYESRLLAVAGSSSHRFAVLGKQLDMYREPAGYEHLAFVAVTPGLRGRGIGRLLVQHHLARLDRAEVPTYADAATNSAREFYRALGYSPTCAVTVPNGSRICLMWRPVPAVEGGEDC
ncbi:GNAT family N-acetyltransferase [Plantactinospora sp. WMMB334]|uniref:GNAT family N-acetyltransferase n=1 Tax=Plantactinospora sp. WMMB334 TaxID=3404119 RepID=UPI003B946DB6